MCGRWGQALGRMRFKSATIMFVSATFFFGGDGLWALLQRRFPCHSTPIATAKHALQDHL